MSPRAASHTTQSGKLLSEEITIASGDCLPASISYAYMCAVAFLGNLCSAWVNSIYSNYSIHHVLPVSMHVYSI